MPSLNVNDLLGCFFITMKKFVLGFLLLIFSFFIATEAYAIVSVKGYYKKNGTYVAPHYRSDPDGIKTNNFSYPGNYNPNTGSITGGNSYYSSPSYSYPSYSAPVTPSCPSMSTYDSISKNCKCMSGYVVGTDFLGKQSCISADSKCTTDYGYGAKYNSSYNKCECRYGYVMSNSKCVSESSYCSDSLGYGLMSNYNSLTKSCECMSGYEYTSSGCTIKTTIYYTPSTENYDNCPLNSHESLTDSTKCSCNSGYEVNLSKTACVLKTTCPLNAVLVNNVCSCVDGYIMINDKCISHTENCKNYFGENVYGTVNTSGDNNSSSCYCNAGYSWNINRTLCEIKEVVCPDQSFNIDGVCYCNQGYSLSDNGKMCVKNKIPYAVSSNTINLREKMSTNSKVLGQLKSGVKYQITDLYNKDWVKIKVDNKEGYVLKKLIKVN